MAIYKIESYFLDYGVKFRTITEIESPSINQAIEKFKQENPNLVPQFVKNAESGTMKDLRPEPSYPNQKIKSSLE